MSWIVSRYLCRTFYCMSLSCTVPISDWIHTLYLPECQNILVPKRSDIWKLNDCQRTRSDNHLVLKKIFNHFANATKWLRWIVSRYLYGAFDCMSFLCDVRISEWIHTLYLPEWQDILVSKRSNILNLYDCHWTRSYNLLLLEKTFNHLARPTKWLIWIMSKYLYEAFDFMSLSYHVCISEWIDNLFLPECQGTSWSKQERYEKFKWLQRKSSPQLLRF